MTDISKPELDEEHDLHSEDSGNVQVMCRFRPVNQNEHERFGENYICEFSENKRSVTISTSKLAGSGQVGTNKFTFDRVFDMKTCQRDVYEASAKPIIEGVLKGFNGTVFAYGQTGSGKTHTMQGPNIEDLELQGIVPRMVRTVFNRIENLSENIEFTIKVSMAEIYMEKVKDLLDPTKVNLKIKENRQKGVYIQNLTERYIGSDAEVYNIMKLGNENRKTASTAMNDTSSRSHSIFIMNITQNNLDDFSSKTGTLFLVDLAGSEKVAKTNVSGQQLDEAKGINKSLSTLGKVIHALTDKKITHVPYRESKLTRILTESLGGNAKTCLIITCSPSPYNELETISTLRFGTAARNIKNKPKINKEYTVPELKRMVAKRDHLISALKKRIKILEQFIKENGLEVPSDEILASLADKLHHEEDGGFDTTPEKHSDKIDEGDESSDNEEEDKDDSGEPQNIIFDDDVDLDELDIIDSELDLDESEVEQRQQAKEIINLVQKSNPESKEANQKIINKYLELQEQLNSEKEQNQAQLNALSSLKEDYEVAKSKLEKYHNEKEDFMNYKEMVDQMLHKLKEEKSELENDFELKVAKLTSTETELAELKKLYANTKNKINKYEENGTEMLINETKENKQFRKEATEGTQELKDQVKLLFDQLQQKDDLIQKIHSSIDVKDDLRQIIEQSQKQLKHQEKEAKMKENNSIIRQMLLGDGDEQLIEDGDSCYLTPKEVVSLIKKHKELAEKATTQKEKCKKLDAEVVTLRKKLNDAVSGDNPDIQSVVDTLVEQRLEDINEKYAHEKEKLMTDLADRVDKVCNLKLQLDSMQEENSRLLLLLNDGDYSSQNQINYLEKQVESISMMYHKCASENSVYKVDIQVSEKKIKSRDKKITKLEKAVTELKDQNSKLRKVARCLKEAVENEKNKKLDSHNLTGIASQGRVVKKIKAHGK